MRRRSRGGSPKLELKLNLSPPRAASFTEAVDESPSSEMSSIDESCVSSEVEEDEARFKYGSSPGTASSSMVLGGCPRCLMYIMLSKVDPRCPRCKNTVLLQFAGNEISKKTTS